MANAPKLAGFFLIDSILSHQSKIQTGIKSRRFVQVQEKGHSLARNKFWIVHRELKLPSIGRANEQA